MVLEIVEIVYMVLPSVILLYKSNGISRLICEACGLLD